jgi:hypothetical protein
MLWWLIIPSVLVGFFIVSRGGVYRAFFFETHLNELAALSTNLHQEAIEALQTPRDTPPNRVTSAGLTVVYTLTPQAETYRAYLSLSYKGGWFAASAAGILVAYLRRCLALPLPFERLGVSARGVYHAAFLLSALPEIYRGHLPRGSRRRPRDRDPASQTYRGLIFWHPPPRGCALFETSVVGGSPILCARQVGTLITRKLRCKSFALRASSQ